MMERVYSAQASLIPEIGIAVVLQDITHLKELDRVKTDFVNTISHDITLSSHLDLRFYRTDRPCRSNQPAAG